MMIAKISLSAFTFVKFCLFGTLSYKLKLYKSKYLYQLSYICTEISALNVEDCSNKRSAFRLGGGPVVCRHACGRQEKIAIFSHSFPARIEGERGGVSSRDALTRKRKNETLLIIK